MVSFKLPIWMHGAVTGGVWEEDKGGHYMLDGNLHVVVVVGRVSVFCPAAVD